MKIPTVLLIIVAITAVCSSCQSPSISANDPVRISSTSCASANSPLPSLSNTETRPLGGGTVQSNEFTIELFLYCDSAFQPDSTDLKYQSDIGDLAIYYNWRYDAPIEYEKTFAYFGMQPNVELRLVSYTQGYISGGQFIGVQIADDSIQDLSKKSALRFVYIAEGPFGQLAGAALSFDLQQVSDGLQPSNIFVTSLLDSELQSVKRVLPTVAP